MEKIKMSLKGLAKYVAASPSIQRRIIQDFKYPLSDEPFAMRLYYREASDCLATFIRERKSGEWLRQRAVELSTFRVEQSASAAKRLEQNSKAVLYFARHFNNENLELLERPRMRLQFSNVRVSVVPDLALMDRTKMKLVKIQFGGPQLHPTSIKVVTQCLFQAAVVQGIGLMASGAVYVDLPREQEHSATQAGKRILSDIKAACETISQVWDSIPPPGQSKRTAAA